MCPWTRPSEIKSFSKSESQHVLGGWIQWASISTPTIGAHVYSRLLLWWLHTVEAQEHVKDASMHAPNRNVAVASDETPWPPVQTESVRHNASALVTCACMHNHPCLTTANIQCHTCERHVPYAGNRQWPAGGSMYAFSGEACPIVALLWCSVATFQCGPDAGGLEWSRIPAVA